MSPVKIKHSFYQGRIQRLLESSLNTEEVMPECAITTSDGVKVADVVWCSEERFFQIEDEVSASVAPEICIEVKSTGNTLEEMEFKRNLYRTYAQVTENEPQRTQRSRRDKSLR